MNINQIQKLEINKIKRRQESNSRMKSEETEQNQRVANFTEKKFDSLQKFKPIQKKGGGFTRQELILFAQKFNQYKSKWTLYTKIFKRTEKEVKNLFYNSLRKLATQLSNAEKKKKQFQKNKIKALVLHSLINISYTVKQCFENMHMEVKELLIFKIKEKIFQYCFINTDPLEEEVLELSKNIRKLKFGLKNLKVGKNIENEKQALKLAQTMIQCQDQPQIIPRIKTQLGQMPVSMSSKLSAQAKQKQENQGMAQFDQYYYQNFMNYPYYPYVPIPCQYLPFSNNLEFVTSEPNIVKAEPNVENTILMKKQEWS